MRPGPASITMEQARRAVASVNRGMKKDDVDPLLYALCSLRTEHGDMITPESAYDVWREMMKPTAAAKYVESIEVAERCAQICLKLSEDAWDAYREELQTPSDGLAAAKIFSRYDAFREAMNEIRNTFGVPE